MIAEAGVNHNGSLDMALQLVDAASAAGTDAVKFQAFRANRLVSRRAQKAAYQKRTTSRAESQYDMLRALELAPANFRAIRAHCKRRGIEFLCSPFDERSADMLESIGVHRYKLGSGEITNVPLLVHVARKGAPLILSTGMCVLADIERALHAILEAGNDKVSLLHCVTEYPSPYDQVNLRAMHTMRAAFGVPVGYSDHTPGIEMPIAAVALGAEIIEKHFTLDRTLPGPDHAASLEPEELGAMVQSIRHVERALGHGRKVPARCELENLAVARKSLVARTSLRAGEVLSRGKITVKRPGDGIPPYDLEKVIGRKLRRAVRVDEVLRWEDIA